MAEAVDRTSATATLNDDIGEDKRLAMHRTLAVLRKAEQRAHEK
jgi:hypothetical protein